MEVRATSQPDEVRATNAQHGDQSQKWSCCSRMRRLQHPRPERLKDYRYGAHVLGCDVFSLQRQRPERLNDYRYELSASGPYEEDAAVRALVDGGVTAREIVDAGVTVRKFAA